MAPKQISLCGAGVLALFFAGPARADELTSAPIDRSIFREGAVERSQRQFGAWTLVCDEVKSLSKRFCSLATEPQDAGGQSAASLVVSTGDDGKPAALLRTPVGVNIAAGVEIAVDAPAAKGKPAARLAKRIDYLSCESASCVVIWSVSPQELAALNDGGAIRMRYERVREIPLFALRIAAPQRSLAVEALAKGAGFKDAVTASLK